jgi:hypothetical protein
MGRHSKPQVTLRKAAGTAAAAGGLAIALTGVMTGAASAEPILGNCAIDGPGSNANPEVTVCQDHGYRHGVQSQGSSNRIHALVKVDPLACVHVVVDPEGNRRLVGTQSCDRHGIPVVPVAPACVPCPTNPCDTPVPVVPVVPAVPETPASPIAEAPPVSGSSSPVAEAPAPTTVVGGPVVAH